MNDINKRRGLEVAQIFDQYGAQYLQRHHLCTEQRKAFHAILNCRTARLGGHLDQCENCGYKRPAYNSCRNRHCPKCQYIKQVQWVDKLSGTLPPTKYFHMVFTIPSSLHKLFYINQKVCYGLLFKASAEALKRTAANPDFQGGEPGAVALLHSWGQALTYHPHIHMIVPAGVVSSDGAEWIPSNKAFFVPVKVLSRIFRAILCRMIEEQLNTGSIMLPDDVEDYGNLKNKLYEKNWNVFAEKPKRGPNAVIRYLARYTHRVAISNSRILSLENGKVTFHWKDYRKGYHYQPITLEATEFIHRFLMHVLPCGFYKVRYYGLLASVNQSKKEVCCQLIGSQPPPILLKGLTAIEVLKITTGNNPMECPKCKNGNMVMKALIEAKPLVPL